MVDHKAHAISKEQSYSSTTSKPLSSMVVPRSRTGLEKSCLQLETQMEATSWGTAGKRSVKVCLHIVEKEQVEKGLSLVEE